MDEMSLRFFQRSRFLVSLLFWAILPGCGGNGQLATNPPPAPPPPSDAIILTVQANQQFQTFEAWRATLNGPFYLKAGGTSELLPPALLSQILDDAAFDLGICGLRIELHAAQRVEVVNDNNDPFVINSAGFDFARQFQIGVNEPLTDPVAAYQQILLPLKARVESRGEPFSTYVSPIYTHAEFPAHWHNAEEYAEVAEAYHIWARATFNFTPTYWAIVNEPGSAFFGTSRELENDVVAVGARLRARGFATRIQTIETVSPDSGGTQGVLANAMARQYVGLLSYHGYDYSTGSVPSFGNRNGIRSLSQQFGMPTGMTEICCKGGWNGSYSHALGWARDIYWNLTEGNISVWEPLSMAFTCGTVGCTSAGTTPIVIDLDHSRYYKFAQYYGLRQFSRYIRPGYQRIGVTCSQCQSNGSVGQIIKPVAFQGPGGRMVVVVINDQTNAQNIGLAGLPAGTYDITGVNPGATTGVTYSPQVVAGGQTLSFSLPAQAIVTFAKQ